jgi:hypothetical protein
LPFNEERAARACKYVSPLNRVIPRPPGVYKRSERTLNKRQERAAAQARIGYRWRMHRRDLRRNGNSITGRVDETPSDLPRHSEVPDDKPTGVDSLRREGVDNDRRSQESFYNSSIMTQGGQKVDHMDLSL